mmetsp:Transcript_6508/g.21741  ORF Transcript_6508/g.21741 Transcript_6508/m.21741 type:complete len:201 (+) Transcript_6508:864-1466(+)
MLKYCSMSPEKSANLNKPRSGKPSAELIESRMSSTPPDCKVSFASLHPPGQFTVKQRSLPSRLASSSAKALPGPSLSVAMTNRFTVSNCARQFHKYSYFLSSSGFGTSPSFTFPGAPSGTETTFVYPASSKANLSNSPSTMIISSQSTQSSKPYKTFSAPLTCQNDLFGPRYLALTICPSRTYGNTSASTCLPSIGEKTL